MMLLTQCVVRSEVPRAGKLGLASEFDVGPGGGARNSTRARTPPQYRWPRWMKITRSSSSSSTFSVDSRVSVQYQQLCE